MLPGQGLVDPSAQEAPVEAPAAEEEFLMQPEEESVAEEPAERQRPPELKAAPGEGKSLAPRSMGPPAGWEPPEEEASSPASPPLAEPPRKRVSAKVPVPLTTRHTMTATASSHRLTQRIRADAAYAANQAAYAQQPQQAAAPPAQQQAQVPQQQAPLPPQQVQAPPQQAQAPPQHYTGPQHPPGTHTRQVYQAAHHAPPQGGGPGWFLLIGALFLGAIIGVLAVAFSPLHTFLGLENKEKSRQYAQDILTVERFEAEQMLNEFFPKKNIDYTFEMGEYREELGSRAPEDRQPESLTEEAEDIRKARAKDED